MKVLNKNEMLKRSKTLTKDFIEKIGKCKSYEDIKAIYNEINSNIDLNFTDKVTLLKKLHPKILKENQKLEKEINEQIIFLEKSKTLTNDFIEKLDKSKTNKELLVVFNLIDSKLQNLTDMDVGILIIKYNEKKEKFLEKSKTLTNDFIEKIDKSKSIIELLDINNEIYSKYQDLTDKDLETLIKKYFEKKEKL